MVDVKMSRWRTSTEIEQIGAHAGTGFQPCGEGFLSQRRRQMAILAADDRATRGAEIAVGLVAWNC